MKYLILIFLLGMVGCESLQKELSVAETLRKETRQSLTSKYAFEKCVTVGHNLFRCENKEVVCYSLYTYRSGGLSCSFKIK